MKNPCPLVSQSTSVLGNSKEECQRTPNDNRWGSFSPQISMATKVPDVPHQDNNNKPGALWKTPILTRSVQKLTNQVALKPLESQTVGKKIPIESLETLFKNPSTKPPHTKDNSLAASSHKMTSNKNNDKFVASMDQPSMNSPKTMPSSKIPEPPKYPSTIHPRDDALNEDDFTDEYIEFSQNVTQEKPPEQEQASSKGGKGKNVQPYIIRRRVQIPGFTNPVEYDDKLEVLTVDADGKHQLVSGSVQPIDVWNGDGVKYYVHFDELYQPIRKGGQLFVRFLGTMAKQERFCPIGEEDWHEVDDEYKKLIIKEIRDRFVIPEGEVYNNIVLQRVDRSWRQYKYTLKLAYWKPNEKSIEAISQKPPPGVTKQNWLSIGTQKKEKKIPSVEKRHGHLSCISTH